MNFEEEFKSWTLDQKVEWALGPNICNLSENMRSIIVDLKDENERLKGYKEAMIREAKTNYKLLNENAKMKCLALHSMSEYCFAKGTIICTNLEFTQQSINKDRKMIHKMNIRDRWGEYFAESYRKMKKALREGK